jgi:hypothetical protein
MSKMKTLICFAIWALAQPGNLAADSPLHKRFANCAGIFSAQMEHAWLMGNADADRFQHLRQTFTDLTRASLPASQDTPMATPRADEHQILSHQIASKIAHKALLQTATFASDSGQARTAKRTVQSQQGQCTRMLLDSQSIKSVPISIKN